MINTTRRSLLVRTSASALLLATGIGARAADLWPTKPIRLVVPFPAGAGPDVYARLYAAELSKALKVSVWVDNKPGASGIIGTDQVAKSAPDGYTVLYGFNQLVTFNPYLFKRLPFDVNADLAPVSQVLRGAYVIVTGPASEFSTLAQVLEKARREPGSINYASYGHGTASHLGFVLLEDLSGVKLYHVPSSKTALVDVMAGQLPLVIEPTHVALPQIRAGKVKAIAVTGAERSAMLPEVPTVAETVPGYELPGWHGVFVPARTPPEIVDALSNELRHITQLPEISQRMRSDAAVPAGTSPEQLREIIAVEQKRWGETIRIHNVRLD